MLDKWLHIQLSEDDTGRAKHIAAIKETLERTGRPNFISETPSPNYINEMRKLFPSLKTELPLDDEYNARDGSPSFICIKLDDNIMLTVQGDPTSYRELEGYDLSKPEDVKALNVKLEDVIENEYSLKIVKDFIKPDSLEKKISMLDAQRAAEEKEFEKYNSAAKFAVKRIEDLNKAKDKLAKIEQTKEVPDQMKEQITNLKRSVEALQNQVNLAVEEIFASPVFKKYEEQERITRSVDDKGNAVVATPAGDGIISITKGPDGNYTVKQESQRELNNMFAEGQAK